MLVCHSMVNKWKIIITWFLFYLVHVLSSWNVFLGFWLGGCGEAWETKSWRSMQSWLWFVVGHSIMVLWKNECSESLPTVLVEYWIDRCSLSRIFWAEDGFVRGANSFSSHIKIMLIWVSLHRMCVKHSVWIWFTYTSPLYLGGSELTGCFPFFTLADTLKLQNEKQHYWNSS